MKKNKLYISLLFFGLILALGFIFSKSKNIEPIFKMELCENITSGRLKVVCYAMFLKNYTFCRLAEDFSPYCYDYVFPLIDLNETFCESLNDDYARLSCFTNLAVKSRNAKTCELLKDSVVKSICYTRLIDYLDQFKNSSICENIPHESTRFTCSGKIANNISYCLNITQEIEERSMCLGILTKNVSYCDIKGTGALSRVIIYSCIRSIAIDLKDIKLCDSIDYEEEKWECKASLSENIGMCNEAWGPWKDFCKIVFIKNILAKKDNINYGI